MTGQPPLIALSNVIIDVVTEKDGTAYPPMAGGAGLYAALAMASWWPQVGLVAGVGDDFAEASGGIAAAYSLLPEALILRDQHCIRSELTYHPDGSGRTERAVYGPDHFGRMAVSPAQIPASLLPALGSYIFQAGDPIFWQEVQARRGDLGTLLWEVDCRMTRDGSPDDFAAVASQADVVSLNLDEARDLLGQGAPNDLFARLCTLSPAIVILRMGDRGALAGSAAIPPVHIKPPPHQVVDVTGGGNAFSGGFLAGLCARPGDIEHAGRCAAAAAACAIAQRGPPAPPDRALLHQLYATTMIRSVGSDDHSSFKSQEADVTIR